jgi:hypothetical protein
MLLAIIDFQAKSRPKNFYIKIQIDLRNEFHAIWIVIQWNTFTCNRGTTWYNVVPRGTNSGTKSGTNSGTLWYNVVPSGTTWYQVVPRGTTGKKSKFLFFFSN